MPDFALNDFIPYRLAILSQSISRLIAQEYESRFGLSMNQWRIIVILAEHGTLTAQEVSNRTLMDKMTISRAVKKLLNRNLIRRSPSKSDRRESLLGLTATGESIHQDVLPLALEYEARLLSSLTPKDQQALSTLIVQLQTQAEEMRH
jgi:DNA-binding MarR family transcriptional regulator